MALLERVGTLLRANVNDLIEKAEDPEKLLRQLVLDMENQLMQVKTQVAIAIADQHLLEKRQKEHAEGAGDWERKAGLAVSKGQDDLARAALERSLSQQQMAQAFAQQLEDQHAETETLRVALGRLHHKLEETRHRCELLVAQGRRARMTAKALSARGASATKSVPGKVLERMKAKILNQQAHNEAAQSLLEGDTLEDRFVALEREERIETLLRDLKAKRNPAQLSDGVAD